MISYYTTISPNDLEENIWRYLNPKYFNWFINPNNLKEAMALNPKPSYTKTNCGRNELVLNYLSYFLG